MMTDDSGHAIARIMPVNPSAANETTKLRLVPLVDDNMNGIEKPTATEEVTATITDLRLAAACTIRLVTVC
jgi:hypothetical protein